MFVNRARRANRSHAALSPSSTAAPANRRAHDSPARSPIGCRLARGRRGPAPSSAGLETWLFLGAGRAGPAARTTRRGGGRAQKEPPPCPERNGVVGRERGREGAGTEGRADMALSAEGVRTGVALPQLRELVQPHWFCHSVCPTGCNATPDTETGLCSPQVTPPFCGFLCPPSTPRPMAGSPSAWPGVVTASEWPCATLNSYCPHRSVLGHCESPVPGSVAGQAGWGSEDMVQWKESLPWQGVGRAHL